jgi:phytoene synthase
LRASDAICSALQLINFWQDVDLDYRKDARIYLPQDEMAGFDVTERHVRERICDCAWQSLMRFQVDRARTLMLSGSELGRRLPGRVGLEIRATIQGGLRILEKIERAGYDVFRRRPKLRAYDWALLLAKAL